MIRGSGALLQEERVGPGKLLKNLFLGSQVPSAAEAAVAFARPMVRLEAALLQNMGYLQVFHQPVSSGYCGLAERPRVLRPELPAGWR
jgi:hypothetical protein